MPWPIGTFPIVEPDHLSGGSTKPALSPGNPTPVARPKPKRAIQRESAILAELLGERDRADVRRVREDLRHAHRLGAALFCVVDDAVGDGDRSGSTKLVCGVTSRSESVPATVTSLKVEPGLVDVGRHAVARDPRRGRAEGVCVVTPARRPSRAPRRVRGSSTTAVAPFACHVDTVCRRTASAFAWIVWSIVRYASRPSRSGRRSRTSITLPSASITRVSPPDVPESLLVEPQLETGEAAVVDSRVAEDVRGHRALRVEAPLLRIEAEPVELAASRAAPPWRGRPSWRRRRSGWSRFVSWL